MHVTTARIRRSYYVCTKAKSTTVKMRLFTDTSVAVASDPFEFYNHYFSLQYVSCPSVCRTYDLEREREREKGREKEKEGERERKIESKRERKERESERKRERSVVVPCTCVNSWIMYIDNIVYSRRDNCVNARLLGWLATFVCLARTYSEIIYRYQSLLRVCVRIVQNERSF